MLYEVITDDGFAWRHVPHDLEAQCLDGHTFGGHEPLGPILVLVPADDQRTDAVGIPERHQAT